MNGVCACNPDSERWPCDGPCVLKCDKNEIRNDEGNCVACGEETECEDTECEETECEDTCPAAVAMLGDNHTLLQWIAGLCSLILALLIALLFGGKEWIERKLKERALEQTKAEEARRVHEETIANQAREAREKDAAAATAAAAEDSRSESVVVDLDPKPKDDESDDGSDDESDEVGPPPLK